jgi:hypothetical protein
MSQNPHPDDPTIVRASLRRTFTPLGHTPGILRWARNGCKLKRDRKALAAVFTDGFGLTDQCAHDLLSGRIPHSIDGNSVVFEYPKDQWRKEKQ